MVLGKLDNHMHRKTSDPCFIPLTKMNLKWIEDINVRPETIKQLEGTRKKKIHDLCFGNYYFLNIAPKVQATKEKINKSGAPDGSVD